MRPFCSKIRPVRRVRQLKFKKAAKLRDSIGVVQSKKLLRTSFLNVDGLNELTLDDVSSTVTSKDSDIVFLVETKRREEETGIDISLPGYTLHEARRSNLAGDKDGGGIALYTKLTDGILFKRHLPNIIDQADAFVNNERVWMVVESQKCKTAICGLYLGCQYGDDRHGDWNDAIYRVVQQEAFALRSKGYRVCYLGDFNGHIGNTPGQGIIGNTSDINPNGRRFLNFLQITNSRHINGECRVPGQWTTRLAKGLWTRQRSGHSSIIDFGVISSEHLHSVVSMEIDDQGKYGGGSDHNWIFLDLSDKFVKQKRISNQPVRKERWNIKEDQDWSGFSEHILESVSSLDTSSVNNLASSISASILRALHATIGLKSKSRKTKPRLLPPDLVKELVLRRELEKNWKTLNSAAANSASEEVSRAEKLYLEQKSRVSDLLLLHRQSKRRDILDQCKGGTPQARKNFWSHVSPSKKQSSDISAVVDPVSGVIRCKLEEIKSEVEKHLTSVFQGSYEKIGKPDQVYRKPPKSIPGCLPDHTYPVNPSPSLPKQDSSSTVESDPTGWLNLAFVTQEVDKMIKTLKNGKAKGWDHIPNEALKNLPLQMVSMITLLFNKIKNSGTLPKGWNRGRVTLVHKRDLRELLGNYRPITVLISMSGLYSRVLNARLSCVSEEHKLLGEVQNGFRKGRGGSDNSFVLDTVIWKAKATRSKLYMSFLDISKAYDSVNRDILWRKLYSLGIKGEFLSSLKSLYTDDCIDCEVNGLLTRPIFLRRGLRQGCSLSPLLFALYISDVGTDIMLSQLGFSLGSICVSGLLFADDIVLIARTSAGLKMLLALVKSRFDELKLTISEDKSQVISPEDESWDLLDSSSNVEMSLKQVALYKYLGTWTYDSMYKTGVEKQKQCVKTATKYKGSCIYVSRMGPDIVDVVLCTWLNVAIPAILNGCDMIPFCETRIEEVERIQAQVAKFALGVSSSTSNICAQTELGMKSFRQHLYERQLKFYFRVIYLPEDRWVHQAMSEHFSGGWKSPYLMYISSVRTTLGIFGAPSDPRVCRQLASEHFLQKTNSVAANLAWIRPQEGFSRLPYVCEDDLSAVITEFKFENEGLGNKQPRQGRPRQPFCPVCPVRVTNCGLHLLFCCSSLSSLRAESGITTFMNLCAWKGFSVKDSYDIFVNGEDSNRSPVSVTDYLYRGKCMQSMRKLWFSKW